MTNNFIQNYEIILTHLSTIDISFDFLQIRKPKLSNIELIAMNLTAEYKAVHSECELFTWRLPPPAYPLRLNEAFTTVGSAICSPIWKSYDSCCSQNHHYK
ncbi:MAG: hypothetical protein WCR58_02980 [Bacteroidales bacterium]|jgi:hypothetical protein|nr:hypothetical protein [Bacteroidales bacterium]MCK9447538.1 hypothetical protein [Bacteroidales bacterium]MDD3700588.1 hypothetical protein [Bacteroidales bacterium]MDY0368288.1 hypothetical protein [Bacteroidales bacterium]